MLPHEHDRNNSNFTFQDDTKWGGLKAGQVMAEPKPIFARIEVDKGGDEDTNPSKVIKSKKKKSQTQGLVEAS